MKKPLFFLITVTIALLAMNFPLAAQPPRGAGPDRETLTAAQRADRQTEIFRRELGLDRKQYKKVYNLYLKKFEKMYPGLSGDMPPGGRRGNGPGGNSSMGRPQGGPPSGGRPAYNAAGQPGREMRVELRLQPEKEKDITTRRKKMEKILDPGQFRKWAVMERELLEHERIMFDRMDGHGDGHNGPGRPGGR